MDLGDQIHKELKLQPFKEKQIDARLASESQHGMINSSNVRILEFHRTGSILSRCNGHDIKHKHILVIL